MTKALSLALGLALVAGCGGVRYSKDAPLLLLPSGGQPADRRPVTDLDRTLGELFAERKPVVLYVHGRGDEPAKTIDKDIVGKLERQHGVRVLMYNWNSKAILLFRPARKAAAAGLECASVLSGLRSYRAAHQEARDVPVTLLAHSMGSLVLQSAVEANPGAVGTAADPLFANIVLTSSDSDAEEHVRWVERLVASHIVLLTVNRDDAVLRLSFHARGHSPLGTADVTAETMMLAPNAWYLDATDRVGGHHRLFAKGALDDQVGRCEILTTTLRGQAPDLTVGKSIEHIKQGRVLVPIDVRDVQHKDPCFKGTVALSEEEEVEDAGGGTAGVP